MRAGIERWLNGIWYGDHPPPWFLRVAVPLYRNRMERDRSRQIESSEPSLEGKPIVVVGNITVGGTGKTPLVIRVVELAQQAGLNPGVVSRGYGRDSNQPFWVDETSDPANCGDEPVLIATQTRVPVRVDDDRAAGAVSLFEKGVDLVISDDGLQHRRLPRQLEICVVDGMRGFGNGQLLPAGPLREPVDRLNECDVIVGNGAPVAGWSGVSVMQLEAGQPWLLGGSSDIAPGGNAGHDAPPPGSIVHGVTGISNPGRFFATLEEQGWSVTEHVFPDHHQFVSADFDSIGRPVLMTAKDAVKCQSMDLDETWVLPVKAVVPDHLEHYLMEEMIRIVRE